MDDFRAIFDSLNTGGVVGVGAILAYLANWVRKLAPPFLELIHAKIARLASKADLPGALAVTAQVIGAIRTLRVLYVKRHGPVELLTAEQRSAMIVTIMKNLRDAFPEVRQEVLNRLVINSGLKRKDDGTQAG